jgi:hypothetical protein
MPSTIARNSRSEARGATIRIDVIARPRVLGLAREAIDRWGRYVRVY